MTDSQRERAASPEAVEQALRSGRDAVESVLRCLDAVTLIPVRLTSPYLD